MPPHFVKNYIDARLLDDLTEQDDRVGAGKWDGHRSKPWPSSILGPSALFCGWYKREWRGSASSAIKRLGFAGAAEQKHQ